MRVLKVWKLWTLCIHCFNYKHMYYYYYWWPLSAKKLRSWTIARHFSLYFASITASSNVWKCISFNWVFITCRYVVVCANKAPAWVLQLRHWYWICMLQYNSTIECFRPLLKCVYCQTLIEVFCVLLACLVYVLVILIVANWK